MRECVRSNRNISDDLELPLKVIAALLLLYIQLARDLLAIDKLLIYCL